MKRIRKWHPIVKINANNGTPRGKENLIKIKVEGLSSIAVDGPHKTSYLETSLAAIIDTIEDNTSLVNQIVVVHGGIGLEGLTEHCPIVHKNPIICFWNHK